MRGFSIMVAISLCTTFFEKAKPGIMKHSRRVPPGNFLKFT